MADPHWTSYVGMATGIIGAITGISGAVIGVISYRKSNEIKFLDLRIELKRTISSFKSDLDKANELLPYANNSRFRVASAIGNLNSGVMVKWKEDFEIDTASLKAISGDFSRLNTSFDNFTAIQLENELTTIHDLQVRLDELTDKYNTELKADDKERDRIRDRHERAPQ